MKVYQRRENLCFFGIKETATADTEKDTKAVLVEFIKKELGIGNVNSFEF